MKEFGYASFRCRSPSLGPKGSIRAIGVKSARYKFPRFFDKVDRDDRNHSPWSQRYRSGCWQPKGPRSPMSFRWVILGGDEAPSDEINQVMKKIRVCSSLKGDENWEYSFKNPLHTLRGLIIWDLVELMIVCDWICEKMVLRDVIGSSRVSEKPRRLVIN